MKKRLPALLLVLVLVVLLLPAGLRASAEQVNPDSDYDGIDDVYDVDPSGNTFSGRMKSGFDSTKVSFTMDYSCFFGDQTVYSPSIASVSVLGSALAYPDAAFTYDTAQTYAGGTASKVVQTDLMRVLGLQDPVDYSLSSDYADDDLSEVLLGHRTVLFNGETRVILAVWIRGTNGTIQEWSSNFNMGDLARFLNAYDSESAKSPRQSNADWTRKSNHRGFDVTATRILRYVKSYVDTYVRPELEQMPEAKLVYWITGHSRGAAVGNILASYLIDDGETVFAYTFAAPFTTANTEASAERYDSIFNLVNGDDFVPTMPMPEWGFTRYGRTAVVKASSYSSAMQAATGKSYSGRYLTDSDKTTLLGKFICITGENASRTNPGRILGWREVYVYHCGHTHAGETVGNYQSTTFREKGGGFLGIGGLSESDYNGYAVRLRKYSYWNGGICQTPAYCLQILTELMAELAQGNTVGGGLTYLTSNKLADKFDFNKQSLLDYKDKLTDPHYMDTYSVIQAQIGSESDPGARFVTLDLYAQNGRPAHEHTYTYVPYPGQEPTCTDDGFGSKYCLCSQLDGDYYDDYLKNVVIPATGHNWQFEGFVWSGDDETGFTAEAAFRCANDETHTQSLAAEVSVQTTEPTCEEDGRIVYTAVYDEWTDTKTVVIPAVGHNWQFEGFVWSGDDETGFTAEAAFRCANDETHTQSLAAEVSVQTTEPTCEEDGRIVYTAVYDEWTDTKTVTLEATGHDWGEPVWTWADDNSTASAQFTCAVCGGTLDLDGTVTVEDDGTQSRFEEISAYRGETYTAPQKGESVYTAEVELDGQTFTDARTVGYVFAGWYADADFTKPVAKTVTEGPAYAKFVDARVLSAKWQLSAKTTAASDSTKIRLLTTVDTLLYVKVGFRVELDGVEKTIESKEVYRQVTGFQSGVTSYYLPTVFSRESQYFMTAVISGVRNAQFDRLFTVTPYWVTLDGTTVIGLPKMFRVCDDWS